MTEPIPTHYARSQNAAAEAARIVLARRAAIAPGVPRAEGPEQRPGQGFDGQLRHEVPERPCVVCALGEAREEILHDGHLEEPFGRERDRGGDPMNASDGMDFRDSDQDGLSDAEEALGWYINDH